MLQLTMASFYPILLMSGIIWPLEAQPRWLSTYLSNFLPLTYSTEAFRNILDNGLEFSINKLIYAFIETYIWTFIFCLGFLIFFSYKKGK